MNKLGSILAVLAVLVPFSAQATIHQVDMVNFEFMPESLTINEGDTVLWINQSLTIHTTTSGTNGIHDSIWDSGNMTSGDSFSFAFDTLVGTFPYYCTPHWSLGMTGVILSLPTGVQEKRENPALAQHMLRSFPNPFRESVRISLTISTPGNITISIFDLAGRHVHATRLTVDTPRTIEYLWNGKDGSGRTVADGIYLCRTLTGDGVAYRKMLKLP